jgi:RNA polymerase sigma factor (TIGR02999 family)
MIPPRMVRSPATEILERLGAGDRQAAHDLLPLVYRELRALARAQMAGKAQTLQPTALVHEAFLRLVGEVDPGWNGRGHFFASAAIAMRRILVEQARRRVHRPVGAEVEPVAFATGVDVLDVDAALRRLEQRDARRAQVVNLRYFAGLSVEETAAALRVSVGTVEREWRLARAMLQRELDALRPGGEGADPSGAVPDG